MTHRTQPTAARYIPVRGLRLYAEVAGDGPGVVLLHTAGTDSRVWLGTVTGIVQHGYTVACVDLPGHGKSDTPADGPVDSIPHFGNFVADIIRGLSFSDPVAVVGCSIGGCIALDMAIRFPDLVSRAVALAATDFNPTVPKKGLQMALTQTGSAGWPARAARNARAASGRTASTPILHRISDLHRRSDPQVAAAALQAWNGHDLRETLGGSSRPIDIVLGSDDFFIPSGAAERLRQYASIGRVDVLEGVGHYPMLEVDDFASYIRPLLVGAADA